MIFRMFKVGVALPLVYVCAAMGAPVLAQSVAPAEQSKPAEAALPAPQTLIDRHIAAIGGVEAITSHNSVHVKGTVSMPANGMSGTVEVFTARPNKRLSRMTLAGIGDVSEGFDGTVAWSISPMTGPMLATGEELAQKAFDADFDSALGIASRYESMKTVEQTTFEGRPVYKLQLTRKGGDVDIEYYDVETGLKAGATNNVKSPMGTVEVTSSVTDYKKFGNLLQPTTVKQTMTGAVIVMTLTSVDYDNVDPALFELPAQIKALVK